MKEYSPSSTNSRRRVSPCNTTTATPRSPAGNSPSTSSRASPYASPWASATWRTAPSRRDTLTKETLPFDGIEAHIEQLLADIQENIYRKALAFRDGMITKVDSYDEFKQLLETKGGFFLCHWDGTAETEERIKAETKATIRCIPFDSPAEEGKDMLTGKPSHCRVLIAKAY